MYYLLSSLLILLNCAIVLRKQKKTVKCYSKKNGYSVHSICTELKTL